MISHIKMEIKIMYSINHPNIIKLYNHFEDDSYVYLVIEYAPGVSKMGIYTIKAWCLNNYKEGKRKDYRV